MKTVRARGDRPSKRVRRGNVAVGDSTRFRAGVFGLSTHRAANNLRFSHVRKPAALAASKQAWWLRTSIPDNLGKSGSGFYLQPRVLSEVAPGIDANYAMPAQRVQQLRRKTFSSLTSHGTLLHFVVVRPTLKTESHCANKRRKLRKQLSSKDL